MSPMNRYSPSCPISAVSHFRSVGAREVWPVISANRATCGNGSRICSTTKRPKLRGSANKCVEKTMNQRRFRNYRAEIYIFVMGTDEFEFARPEFGFISLKG